MRARRPPDRTRSPRRRLRLPARASVATDERTMSLVDHLAELRRRVCICILAVLVFGAVSASGWRPRSSRILSDPLPPAPPGQSKLQLITVSGGFLVYMQSPSSWASCLACRSSSTRLWAFVAPGLTPRERRAALPWIPMTRGLLPPRRRGGLVTLPYAIGFLPSFQIAGSLEALPSAEAYFGFVTIIFLIFGLVMQFPIVLVFLDQAGRPQRRAAPVEPPLRAAGRGRLRRRRDARRRPHQPARHGAA